MITSSLILVPLLYTNTCYKANIDVEEKNV